MKKLISIIIVMILTTSSFSLPKTSAKESLEDVGVFINGEFISTKNMAKNISNRNYLPIEIIKRIPNIEIDNSEVVTISGYGGSLIISGENSYIEESQEKIEIKEINNTKYVSIRDLSKISYFVTETYKNSGAILIYTDEEGKQRSTKTINKVNASRIKKVMNNLGKKVYLYGIFNGGKYAWVSGYDLYTKSVNFTFSNGEMKSYPYAPSTQEVNFLSEKEYLDMQKYVGRTFWFNKNAYLMGDSKLNNLEKVTIKKIYLDNEVSLGLVVSLSRENGSTLNQSLYVYTDISTSLDAAFYFEDPHKKYNWSKKVWDDIHKQYIFIGMTKEQAKLSWGSPKKINKTVTGNVTYEQWVYNNGDYVYFRNGKLTSWQDF